MCAIYGNFRENVVIVGEQMRVVKMMLEGGCKVMKVVLIFLQRRGSGTLYSLNMAKELNKRVDLLCIISKDIRNKQEWYDEELNVKEVETFNNYFECLLSTLKFSKFVKLKKQILKFRPDVIYYPMLHVWIPILNLFFKTVPNVYTMHDPILHKGEKNFILQNINLISARQANRVVLLSKVFENVVTNYGIKFNNIDIIPHGEYSYYTQNGIMYNQNFKNTILFFGRINEYKGLDVLLKAFKKIYKKNNNTKLLIVGSGNIEKYEELLIDLDNVEIVNRWIGDDEISNFFDKADFLVAPYIDASQSGVIPTAYAFSMPVVTTNIGGLAEQVEEGRTGFLVESQDIDDLADCCLKLLNNPKLIKQMGQNAYQKSKTEMSWKDSVEKLLSGFNKINR